MARSPVDRLHRLILDYGEGRETESGFVHGALLLMGEMAPDFVLASTPEALRAHLIESMFHLARDPDTRFVASVCAAPGAPVSDGRYPQAVIDNISIWAVDRSEEHTS